MNVNIGVTKKEEEKKIIKQNQPSIEKKCVGKKALKPKLCLRNEVTVKFDFFILFFAFVKKRISSVIIL